MADQTKKSCFVISPIGDDGTKTRRQSDCVLEYIIKPSLTGLNYSDPVRVDKADKPTHITTEIILNLVHANLVIADLSDLNANVFYELGIRHAYRKPCILLSDWEVRPPFDVAGVNTIRYIYDDPKSHSEVIMRIRDQIATFDQSTGVSNPVSVALGLERLSESGDSLERIVLSLSEQVESLQTEMEKIKSDKAREVVVNALLGASPSPQPSRISRGILTSLANDSRMGSLLGGDHTRADDK